MLKGSFAMLFYNWLSGLRPKMIEVHHYKALDAATGKWIVAPLKCSAKHIARMKGEIIGGTMELVARSSLDKKGHLDPKARKNRS
jgi:hypothetical protein